MEREVPTPLPRPEGNVLEAIAARTRQRVAEEKEARPLADAEAGARVRAAAELARDGKFTFPFEQALRRPGTSLVCEVKRASPSKGLIAADFDPVAIAGQYEEAGAAAISCLTEPCWFLGKDEYLAAIADAVSIPVLRKDFVVDEYMIFRAKELGASAVLLICSILSDEELASFVALAHQLGMSALVEAYEPEEVPRALAAGARAVGANNRDLRTFAVDFGRSLALRPLVGPERIFVSESGVRTAEDIERLRQGGVDAVLVGEALMRKDDRGAALHELDGRGRQA
jgi:indole-3-glycerol phosphate synthase